MQMQADFAVFLVSWNSYTPHGKCEFLQFSGLKLCFTIAQKVQTGALLPLQVIFRWLFRVTIMVIGNGSNCYGKYWAEFDGGESDPNVELGPDTVVHSSRAAGYKTRTETESSRPSERSTRAQVKLQSSCSDSSAPGSYLERRFWFNNIQLRFRSQLRREVPVTGRWLWRNTSVGCCVGFHAKQRTFGV